MAEYLLELRSLSKNFSDVQAVRDLSLEVPRGSLIEMHLRAPFSVEVQG